MNTPESTPAENAPSPIAPNVPLRLELAYEVPGSREQVWDAIATSAGISAWFIPTDVEEHLGGAVCFHMGPDLESPGSVTGWEPPHRFAYVEPDWATLAGYAKDSVTPLATEFLVEAQSGGTCVVRVVSSAFGTGADWEQEFFDEMARGWDPYFTNLRLYLTHFPGQHAVLLDVSSDVGAGVDAAWQSALADLGVREVGARVSLRGYDCTVEQLTDNPPAALLQVHDPVRGLLVLTAWQYPPDAASTTVSVSGRFFADGAAAFVEDETPAWKQWIDGLAVPASREVTA